MYIESVGPISMTGHSHETDFMQLYRITEFRIFPQPSTGHVSIIAL